MDCWDSVFFGFTWGDKAAGRGLDGVVSFLGVMVDREPGDLQLFQGRFDVWELEEDGLVCDFLVVEHHPDTPDNGREANVFGAGQVIQYNLWLACGRHVVMMS